MELIDGVFYVIVLIVSVVVHEFAHGYTAYLLGDNTARHSGRLTLNPLKHLDMFGSVILPLLLIISNSGFLIGWAKPVPYNPDNLRKGKYGKMLVAISGILTNIFIAVIFGLIIRFGGSLGLPPFASAPDLPFYKISIMIVTMNLVLALFNLIPIPPLDGSKVLFSFLPARYRHIENILEKWGFVILLFFLFFIWSNFTPLIYMAFSWITGVY